MLGQPRKRVNDRGVYKGVTTRHNFMHLVTVASWGMRRSVFPGRVSPCLVFLTSCGPTG